MADLQDDELYLPRTVVNKLIKEMVPNLRVSMDARDLLLNCCSEFIHLLASEASEVSEKQQKKVISPEHVLEALSTLGFHEYIDDVKAVHREYKEQASRHRRRGKSRLERLGIPEEELLRQQQQLFEEARQQHLENDLLEQQKLQAQATTTASQITPLVPSHPSSLSPAQSPQSTALVTSTTQPSTQQTAPTASQAPALTKPQASPSAASISLSPSPQPPLLPNLQPSVGSQPPLLHAASGGPQAPLLPANLQATASLLQSLTSGQMGGQSASPLSMPHLLPLNPAVLQTMQGSSTTSNLLQQASQTANLLQAARATEMLRQQVAVQQASLAAVQQQQLKLLQQQQLKKGEGERGQGGEDDKRHN